MPMRARLAGLLRSIGHDVVGMATNGRAAIALCELERPDIAVLDVLMPPGDGKTAARKIVADDLAGQVIIVSSNSQDAIVKSLAAQGVILVTKPLADDQFLAAVAKATARAND
jgi:CheY-like chemotaxis protein